MSTTAHPSETAGQSQCDRILAALQQHPGEWIGMPTLCHLSGSYNVHSRIAELRARGHTIEHKNERRDGLLLSFYRLISDEHLSPVGTQESGESNVTDQSSQDAPTDQGPLSRANLQPSTFNDQPTLL